VSIHYLNECQNSHEEFFSKADGEIGHFVSMSPVGGGENEELLRGNVLYSFGIIDFFTKYTVKKKVEHFLKAIVYDSEGISCTNPTYYATRLYEFIRSHVL
jgi:hypothetical protein